MASAVDCLRKFDTDDLFLKPRTLAECQVARAKY